MQSHEELAMRTTLDIDDDVLAGAQARAARERMALQSPDKAAAVRNGIPLLGNGKKGRRPVTLELVNQLRDKFS